MGVPCGGTGLYATLCFATGENGLMDGDKEIDAFDTKRSYGFNGGMDYQVTEHSSIGFVGGVLHEDNAMLGLYGTGGFATPDTDTYYMGLTARAEPVEKLTVQGAYYYGISAPRGGTALMQTGRLVSDSFAVDARYRLSETDMAGVQLSSPLRIRSGKALFDLPVGRDPYTNAVYRERVEASLKPSGREYDVSLYYTKAITPSLRLKSQAGVRFNPGHVSNAPNDYNVLLAVDWLY